MPPCLLPRRRRVGHFVATVSFTLRSFPSSSSEECTLTLTERSTVQSRITRPGSRRHIVVRRRVSSFDDGYERNAVAATAAVHVIQRSGRYLLAFSAFDEPVLADHDLDTRVTWELGRQSSGLQTGVLAGFFVPDIEHAVVPWMMGIQHEPIPSFRLRHGLRAHPSARHDGLQTEVRQVGFPRGRRYGNRRCRRRLHQGGRRRRLGRSSLCRYSRSHGEQVQRSVTIGTGRTPRPRYDNHEDDDQENLGGDSHLGLLSYVERTRPFFPLPIVFESPAATNLARTAEPPSPQARTPRPSLVTCRIPLLHSRYDVNTRERPI